MPLYHSFRQQLSETRQFLFRVNSRSFERPLASTDRYQNGDAKSIAKARSRPRAEEETTRKRAGCRSASGWKMGRRNLQLGLKRDSGTEMPGAIMRLER